MPDLPLRLLLDDRHEPSPVLAACRVAGCAGPTHGELGFCAVCQLRYEAITARRGRLVEALCARLGAIGDPLFAVFGGQRGEFGAHVLAHLEELNAIDLHVPAAAVEDFVDELDDRARERR